LQITYSKSKLSNAMFEMLHNFQIVRRYSLSKKELNEADEKRPRSVSETVSVADYGEIPAALKSEIPITEGEKLLAEAVIKPPDGGYGWIVVIACFLTNIIVDGIILCGGQALIPVWTKYFSASGSSVSLIISLQSSFYYFAGPIGSAFVNLFGCRAVTIFGTALAVVGLLLSMLGISVQFMYLTYGALSGLGMGTIYLNGIIVVSEYFEAKRALATGLAVCGTGIGTFMFPPLIKVFLDQYTWQQTVMLLAGITMHCFICGALYRPLKVKAEQVKQFEENLNSLLKDENEVSFQNRVLARLASTNTSVDNKSDSLTVDSNLTTASSLRGKSDQQFVRRAFNSQKSYVRSSFAERLPSRQLSMSIDLERAKSANTDEIRKLSMASIRDFNRPLNRTDLFFSGSKRSLQTLTSVKDLQKDDSAVEEQNPVEVIKPSSCVETMKNTFMQMIDFSLFASPTFLLFSACGFLSSVGYMIPYIYLPLQSMLDGDSPEMATMLLSILGIINTFGRVFSGWLSDRPKIDCIMLQNFSNFLAGTTTMLLPHLVNYPLKVVYCFLFGTGIAGVISLRSIVCVELLGLNNLTNVFGLLMVFIGFANLAGPPICAVLYEATGTYQLSFYVSGGLMVLAGVFGCALRKVSIAERKREAEKKKKKMQKQKQKISIAYKASSCSADNNAENQNRQCQESRNISMSVFQRIVEKIKVKNETSKSIDAD
ncbi:Monocarboxylate transporter 5, partial [Trichinella papuae]